MDKPCFERALVLVGAVIGAGFASDREVMSFFSMYGRFSWLMILVSAGTMVFLCCLCFSQMDTNTSCHWCSLYMAKALWVRRGAEGCILLLQAVISGSMISAAGHMAALALPGQGAYSICAMGTLVMALLLGYGRLKPLTIASSFLTVGFVAVVFVLLVMDGDRVASIALQPPVRIGTILLGCVRAVAYAAVNMTLALGIVCRVRSCSCMVSDRTAGVFGSLMIILLFCSNLLYIQCPDLQEAAFPMVVLLARFGKLGFVISLSMLYLAILTTLTASLYALRTGLESRMSSSAS